MSKQRLTLRKRQAQITRSLILEAARKMFLDGGYTNTTIEAIAERAGVAVSTVYAVYQSKRGILRAIREAWHNRSHIREFLYSEQADASPAERLDRLAAATRQQWETGSEVIAIYRSAAAADPEAADELAVSREGRRKGLDAFTQGLEGNFQPGLEPAEAVVILRALCLFEIYEEMVITSGWTADAYQYWLSGTLISQLLPNNTELS